MFAVMPEWVKSFVRAKLCLPYVMFASKARVKHLSKVGSWESIRKYFIIILLCDLQIG